MPPSLVNPMDGSLVREYAETTPAEARAALAAAASRLRGLARTSFPERSAVLLRAGAILRERREALARLMALEMGKPVVWTCSSSAAARPDCRRRSN